MRMSHRAKLGVAGAGALATVVAVTAVWAATGNSGPQVQAVANQPATVTTTTAVTTTTTTSASPTTTATTTTSLSRTTTKQTTASRPTAVMPAPTAHAVDVPVPPPPHPAPVPGCTPTHTGTDAAVADVKSALTAAANKQYWAGTSSPPMLAGDAGAPGSEPAVITVPPALLEAVAWQESGWQSSIHACDGGVGAMQIMAPTATWMNNRFGTSYDYTGLAGNAAIGAEYLEWLIAYFGENFFGYHYDMSDPDLMAAVIGAYNAGPSAVQFAGGHTVVSRYAANVEALMGRQPWG